jgi:endonuclease-8
VPEGDTVFLTGQRLGRALTGAALSRGELRHPNLATVNLAGRSVLGVRTVGKHIFIRFNAFPRFDGGASLHSHLKMDGDWHLYAPNDRWRGPTHEIRVILANDHRVAVGFRLHDLTLLPTEQESRLVGHLGPDLLGADWNDEAQAEAARRLAAGPDRQLGLALADQRIMAGVGNVYKAEVCFLLGVSPWAKVSEVDATRAVALSRELLLRNAWRPQQSTTGELTRGRQHWVYMRTGKPCRRCGTTIRSGIQDSHVPARHTWFCPTCQPGPHPGTP